MFYVYWLWLHSRVLACREGLSDIAFHQKSVRQTFIAVIAETMGVDLIAVL